MGALDYARTIYFEKTSPISGPFRLRRYPFVGKPLQSLDDIRKRQTVVYKASSTMGTVFGQIALSYRIEKKSGDQLFVCQSDADAEKWTKTRGKPFLKRLPGVRTLLNSDHNSVTNDLWQFIHKNLIITGNGKNSQNSDQVRFVETDEGHLYAPGTMAAFTKRMGGRWDSHGLHISTAANEGMEIDVMYHEGTQDEWHHRCPKCGNLIWLLWEGDAKDFYQQKVFHWKEFQSDQMTLESIELECPHCSTFYKDESLSRAALCCGIDGESAPGDYVPMNPEAAIDKDSYRWSVFAAHWIEWKTSLGEWLAAIKAARLGDLSKHEDFRKKRECKTYKPELPDTGEVIQGQDYELGDTWETPEERCRFLSFDVQDSPLHFWAECAEFARDGTSRRLSYDKLDSWSQLDDYRQQYNVEHRNVGIDLGHRQDEVFKICAQFKWLALGASDEDEFTHYLKTAKKDKKIPIKLPYSPTDLQDARIGRARPKRRIRLGRGRVPPGFCLSRFWSKPRLCGFLYALKNGTSGRYFGVAKNINPHYPAQLNSFVPIIDTNKKTGGKSLFYKTVRDDDHARAASSQNIVLAMIRGFFPLDFTAEQNKLAQELREQDDQENKVTL